MSKFALSITKDLYMTKSYRDLSFVEGKYTYVRDRTSLQLVATCISIPLSNASKCRLPQWIFNCSRVRRSRKLSLPLVSRMKYSFSSPFFVRCTAQSGLYVPIGVSILNRSGILKNIFTSGALSKASAKGFSTELLSYSL